MKEGTIIDEEVLDEYFCNVNFFSYIFKLDTVVLVGTADIERKFYSEPVACSPTVISSSHVIVTEPLWIKVPEKSQLFS